MGYLTNERTDLNALQERTVKINRENGWYEQPVPVPEMIALIHSEASEALEAWREGEPYSFDRDGKPEGLASEFADVVIRVMDYCARLDINLAFEVNRKLDYNATREHRHGGKRA